MIKNLGKLVLALAAAYMINCSKAEKFEGYLIYTKYDSKKSQEKYVIKRPDGFKCTIYSEDRKVLISQNNEFNYSIVSEAYAQNSMSTTVTNFAATTVIINSMNNNNNLSKHKKKLDALTPKERERICNDCLRVLDAYMAQKEED